MALVAAILPEHESQDAKDDDGQDRKNKEQGFGHGGDLVSWLDRDVSPCAISLPKAQRGEQFCGMG
jgi:hypothetical protein